MKRRNTMAMMTVGRNEREREIIAKLPPHIKVIEREKIIEHPYTEPLTPLEEKLIKEHRYRVQYVIT